MKLSAYYRYWKSRLDAHGIHSPFVFDFYNSVLAKADDINDKSIRATVSKLKEDDRILNVQDYGAGSKKLTGNKRKISGIAKTASTNRKFGKLLAQIIERYKLNYVVELGTSLGIGSLYLTHSTSVTKLVTIEGSSEIAGIAQENFRRFNKKNIDLLIGPFSENLTNAVEKIPKIDLVYIDGNHTYQATMDYFNFFVDRLDDNGFIIFDDIYWSDDMEKAWKEICDSPKIHVSIDLFQVGIVCKRSTQAKQHFVLKY